MLRPISFTALAAAALLSLAACSGAPSAHPDPSAPVTAPASSTPEPTSSALPAADFAGDWAGIATQGSATHDVNVSLTESAGGYTGTIRHDELQCSGVLNDGVVSDGVLTIQKHIDVVGNCIVDLEVTLTLVDAQTLRYDTDVSTALLTRP